MTGKINLLKLTEMKKIEITLYSFDELSEQAKERAINNFIALEDSDIWQHERLDSFKKAKDLYLQLKNIKNEISGSRLVAWINNNLSYLWIDKNRISKHTDGKIKNCYYSYKYDCTKFYISKIFVTNNIEDCPLTGVCYDFDFLQPIIDFLKNPSSKVSNIDLYDSLPSYESISERDFEYYNSDEFIIETIQANEYTFTEDGKLYNS